MKGKKGTITLFLITMFSLFIILILAAVFAPLGVQFTSDLYVEAENIMLDANDTIAQINNTEIRTNLLNSMDEALDAGEFNIEVLTDVYQYAWVVVVVLVGLIVFIFTRSLVEQRSGGGII